MLAQDNMTWNTSTTSAHFSPCFPNTVWLRSCQCIRTYGHAILVALEHPLGQSMQWASTCTH